MKIQVGDVGNSPVFHLVRQNIDQIFLHMRTGRCLTQLVWYSNQLVRSGILRPTRKRGKKVGKGKKKDKKQKMLANINYSACNSNRTGQIDAPFRSLAEAGHKSDTDIDRLYHDFCKPGVFFGTKPGSDPLKYAGMPKGADGNIMVVGGNGSGKSAGIAKPTLAMWTGTMCVTDIKGELSSFYKELLSQRIVTRPCIIFDPTDVEGPSYDPFWWPQQDDKENLSSNMREIAQSIIPIPPDIKEPFWLESERAVLEAALLHYFLLDLSFSEAITAMLVRPLSELCEELERSQDSRILMMLGETARLKEGKTLACIDRGLRNKLALFAADPYISPAFRGAREGANTFSWADLDQYNIFLRIPAHKIDQWGRAIALMYAQLIRHLERRPEKYSTDGRKCVETLLLMDEFPRMGKMEMITSAMATLRSKKVNICLMIQSVAQLDKIYGSNDRRIIFDNCQYQAILRANDPETQKYLAELIGTRICRRNSVSETLDQDLKTAGYSRSVAETRDRAVCPHELAALEDVLVLSPYGFFRAGKVLPDSNLRLRVLTAVSGPVCEDGRAALDDPIFPGPRRNKEAKMLTVKERAAIVMPRPAVEERFLPPQQESKQVFQTEDPECFSRAVGELVLQSFPEIGDLEENFQKGEAGWQRPLEDVLRRLVDSQALLENMKREVRWPGSKDGNV